MKLEDTPPTPERLLVLRLARRQYALRACDISGLAEPGALRQVPLAPPGVLGLTEWRGRLLTVLDLPRLLCDEALDISASLVRLAPPFEHTALFVPGPVQLRTTGTTSDLSSEPEQQPDDRVDEAYQLLDPVSIVECLEREILEAATRPASEDGAK